MANFVKGVKSGVLNYVHQKGETGMETILVQGKRFTVMKEIGEGTYSTVYMCHNSEGAQDIPNQVAVKRMMVLTEHLARAHQEMDLLTAIDHKHIVKCHAVEVARVEGRHSVSIVQDYCSGTLVEQMKALEASNAKFRESDIYKIFGSAVSAMAYLHAQDPPITHRDIKAENLLFSAEDGNIYKLCDFGSATTEAHHCRTQLDVNKALTEVNKYTTIAYRAPEMADPWRRQRIDEKSDVWALGVLLYYITYFKMPFEETNLSILNGQYTFPLSTVFPNELDIRHIITQCLVQNPVERWSVFDLQRYLMQSGGFMAANTGVVFTNLEPNDGASSQPCVSSSSGGSLTTSTPPPRATTSAAGGNLLGMLDWSSGKKAAPPTSSTVGGSAPQQQSNNQPAQSTSLFGATPQTPSPPTSTPTVPVVQPQPTTECPLCFASYPTTTIEQHAASCSGPSTGAPSPSSAAVEECGALFFEQQKHQPQGQQPPPSTTGGLNDILFGNAAAPGTTTTTTAPQEQHEPPKQPADLFGSLFSGKQQVQPPQNTHHHATTSPSTQQSLDLFATGGFGTAPPPQPIQFTPTMQQQQQQQQGASPSFFVSQQASAPQQPPQQVNGGGSLPDNLFGELGVPSNQTSSGPSTGTPSPPPTQQNAGGKGSIDDFFQ